MDDDQLLLLSDCEKEGGFIEDKMDEDDKFSLDKFKKDSSSGVEDMRDNLMPTSERIRRE